MDSEVVLDADKINKRKSTCVNLVYARRPKKPKTITPVEAVTPGAEPINNNDPSSSGQSQPYENGVLLLKEQPQEPLVSLLDARVKICLSVFTPKPEINDLKGKLEQELEHVRILHQKLEDKENEIEKAHQHQQQQQTVMVDAPVVYNHNLDHVYQQQQQALQLPTLSHYHTPPVTTFDRRSLSRDSSDTGRFRHLSVSVTDNNEYLEKEKRTPKANHLYANSEFLLGKDRLPPESNKRPKPTTGLERHKIQVFRSCSTLLQRLMKHKNGWVFNEPVNAKLLGLFDYHDFIKRPMDLGTIKSRLAQNFYKVPTEFAEDVRLTFNNALTYNPRGHEVYVMAEQLLNLFEEKWSVIESDWNYGPPVQHNQHQFSHSQSPNFLNPVRTLDRSQSTMVLPRPATIDRSQSTMVLPRPATIDRSQSMVLPRPATIAPSRRTPVPKKPKAREPNKRDMTYEEKKKLSSNLQSLPSDHLDGVIQIIKKNNTLTQNDEEIEIEIDSVDIETLWELDRYVTNYRKNLSKVRRRAEIQQARALAGNDTIQNPVVSVPDAPNEKRADEQGPAPTPLNQGENENRGDNDTDSSSSSSDSSSSDSDSDSSSEEGSPRG